nr:MAG TPA: conotoxin [Caudoviricetes sp.]
MNILLLKNWKLIAVLVCAVLVVSAWQYDHAAQYKRGRESMAAEISGRLKDAAIEKAKSDQVISEKYQSEKAVREEKERVRYVQVQKIVEKPVFRNSCVDADGLSVINAAIADGN